MSASVGLLLWVCFSWISRICAVSHACEPPEDEYTALFCKNITVSNALPPVSVKMTVNVCSYPLDITFIVQCVKEKWKWQHTYVNEDEVHQILGPTTYTLLRVKINQISNSSVEFKASFAVDGERIPGFISHTFVVNNVTCPVILRQVKVTDMKDMLPLFVFIALCVLIIITIIVGFVVWFFQKRRRRQPASKQSSIKNACSRPVSTAYSYTDEDYTFETDKNRFYPNKHEITVIKNNIYNENVIDEESTSPYVYFKREDDVKYSSLPRHFGGQTFAEDIEECANESRTLPRKRVEKSDVPAREILAKEYLNIHSGTSQPHYSATQFRSFKDGNVPTQKTANPCDSIASNSTSNSSSPKTINVNNIPRVLKRKRERDNADNRLSSVRLLHDHDQANPYEEDDHDMSYQNLVKH